MMDDLQKVQLQRAKKKVETIKKFYKHVITYILVNLFLTFVWSFKFKIFGDLIFSNQYNSDGFKHIPFWLIWGIFLLFDAFRTFGFFAFFNKNWEERKIKEFMK
tara:strand:+ start:305 stop:616 length:312 start_codon:yes stop_codon:yes gene_type:complete